MTRQNTPTQSATHRLHQALRIDAPPDWPAARAAILAGAPVDTAIQVRAGATPLIVAATLDGCTAEVGWLLDHGAAIDARDNQGETALVRAVQHRRTADIALLLQRGADPNVRDLKGWPVLVLACWTIGAGSAKDIIATFIGHGADPNARARDGRTVLMAAPLMTDVKSAKDLIVTLLDHGADPAATTPDGRTAPEIFMTNGHPKPTGCLDEVLASDHRAAARRRLLDKLTDAQCAQWLPKSTVAEATMEARKAWRRTP